MIYIYIITILATIGILQAFRSAKISKRLQFKPFSCDLCMTFWIALFNFSVLFILSKYDIKQLLECFYTLLKAFSVIPISLFVINIMKIIAQLSDLGYNKNIDDVVDEIIKEDMEDE